MLILNASDIQKIRILFQNKAWKINFGFDIKLSYNTV